MPPVASTSSMIRTRSPGCSASRWISRESTPYSSSYVLAVHVPGQLAGLADRHEAGAEAYGDGRGDDEAACLDPDAPCRSRRSAKASARAVDAPGRNGLASASSGVMSLNDHAGLREVGDVPDQLLQPAGRPSMLSTVPARRPARPRRPDVAGPDRPGRSAPAALLAGPGRRAGWPAGGRAGGRLPGRRRVGAGPRRVGAGFGRRHVVGTGAASRSSPGPPSRSSLGPGPAAPSSPPSRRFGPPPGRLRVRRRRPPGPAADRRGRAGRRRPRPPGVSGADAAGRAGSPAAADLGVAGLAFLQHGQQGRGDEDRRVGTGESGRRTGPGRSPAAPMAPRTQAPITRIDRIGRMATSEVLMERVSTWFMDRLTMSV